MDENALSMYEEWRRNDLTPKEERVINELKRYMERQKQYSLYFREVITVNHLFNLNSHTYGLGNDLDRMLYFLEDYAKSATQNKCKKLIVNMCQDIIYEGKKEILAKLKYVKVCGLETDEKDDRPRRFMPELRNMVQEQGPLIQQTYLNFFDSFIALTGKLAEVSPASLTRDERIRRAVRQIVEEGLIEKKREWAAINQIISEKVYPELDTTEFHKMLCSYDFIPQSIMPSLSSISKVAISRKHPFPDWRIDGLGPIDNAHFISIARRFLELYNRN